MRALSESETKNLAFIVATGYPYALVQLTATALQHGMTDATTPVRTLFKETGIHNYEAQENGPEAKVYIKTIIVTFRRTIETVSSAYRSGSRGDCRLWFGSEIYPLTSADDIYAIVVRDQLLYIFNITKLDISSFIRSSLPNPIKSFFKQGSVNK